MLLVFIVTQLLWVGMGAAADSCGGLYNQPNCMGMDACCYMNPTHMSPVFACPSYSSSGNPDPRSAGTPRCVFWGCPDETIVITNFYPDTCVNDTYLSLYNPVGVFVVQQDDANGNVRACNYLTVTLRFGTCGQYTLYEGCADNESCSATVYIYGAAGDPTYLPTQQPSPEASRTPSSQPAALQPTVTAMPNLPSAQPSGQSSSQPSCRPSTAPPTTVPSSSQTTSPTVGPSTLPTTVPISPTIQSTMSPTTFPRPTTVPSVSPPAAHTAIPSPSPMARTIDRIRRSIGETAMMNARPNTINRSGAFVARAVRSALGEGSFDHEGAQPFEFGPLLKQAGFARLNGFERREDGDVAVWGSVPRHPTGHVQIFFEGHWFSDYAQQQLNPWPHDAYGSSPTFYRYVGDVSEDLK
jgi:hypothetical protein